MSYKTDKRVVLTLDAGGTNFVFSAVQAEQEIIEPFVQSAKGENLEAILKNIIEGFNRVKLKINKNPLPSVFAFPVRQIMKTVSSATCRICRHLKAVLHWGQCSKRHSAFLCS